MFRVILVLAFALAAIPVVSPAQVGTDMPAPREASMLVSGAFDIEPDGSVSSIELKMREKLPAYVVDMVDKAAKSWQFEPILVDGVAVPARAYVSLRLFAVPTLNDAVELSIGNATFLYLGPSDAEHVVAVRREVPLYPFQARERNASGDVYLLVRINRKGRVVDTAVEQVNLREVSDGRTAELLRKQFSEAVVRAARRWIFRPPTAGPHSGADSWTLRTPVSFLMDGTSPSDEYGRWVGYVPGPRQKALWLEEGAPAGNDALASGAISLVGAGPRLLTALQPET